MSGKTVMTTPENAVKNAILQFLQIHRIYHFRQNVGTVKIKGRPVKFGHTGQADILGMLPGGRFLAIECKASNGRTSPAQVDFLAMVNDGGGVGILAYRVEDVIERLRAEGYAV